MRRGLLILLGLLVVTWFEIQVYPGHSYLQGETQLLVPMLERLDTPGFLSRDLVASNPSFAYTIFDEITESLHSAAHLSFEQALLAQQILFRFAAIVGIFIFARAFKMPPAPSLALSAVVNAITHLASPHAFVTNPEATPASCALPLIFLAAGFLVNRKPLLAGLAAGLGLLYDPITAAAFWLVVLTAYVADKSLRRFLRPACLALLIFVLMLGNLVQLQSGLGGGQELTRPISAAMLQLTSLRTPWVWVSNWAPTGILTYAFLAVAGVWALARLGKLADKMTRWVALGLMASGFISLEAAMPALQFTTSMTPARNLSLTVTMSVLLCGAASWHAPKLRERLPWLVIVLAALLNAQVLDLLHLKLDVATHTVSSADTENVRALATWANQNTWGSSLFQFPDAGKQIEPGIFRALSKRSLWADWQSGLIADYSDQAGQEWWSRWRATMTTPYSPEQLQKMLPLPIDYYVLTRAHQLTGIKPVYANSAYVVYDAQDLREAH